MTQQTNYYPEGVGGAPGLGFIALSVTIDNYSGSWGWVPGAGRYVRPWTQGAVFSLGSTQVGDIEWQTPPNISPAPVGNGQLTAIWSDIPPTSAMVSEGTGISVFSASSNPIPIAGSVATPYPVQTTAQLLTIPSGLQSLAIYNPSLAQSVTLTVLGVQSGLYYARAYVLPQTFTGELDNPLVIYLSPLDTQISLLSGIGIRNVIVIGYPSPLTPSPLAITPAPTAIFPTYPVPLQPPLTQLTKNSYANTTSGNSTTLITGGAGTITIYGFEGNISFTAFTSIGLLSVYITDTTGTVGVAAATLLLDTAVGQNSIAIRMNSLVPIVLPAGAGLMATEGGGGGFPPCTISYNVVYTQQ